MTATVDSVQAEAGCASDLLCKLANISSASKKTIPIFSPTSGKFKPFLEIKRRNLKIELGFWELASADPKNRMNYPFLEKTFAPGATPHKKKKKKKKKKKEKK